MKRLLHAAVGLVDATVTAAWTRFEAFSLCQELAYKAGRIDEAREQARQRRDLGSVHD